ncbi:MAG: YdcF family protein [Verrucomicrobia bacterium]|nr:YdcF family protein [Verrucomicrobiota bacterium]
MKLFSYRKVLFPTSFGWFLILLIVFAPISAWLFYGEAYLSPSNGSSAEILVVESWIGLDGIRAAVREFEENHYQLIVAVGGERLGKWDHYDVTFAEMGEKALLSFGVPHDQVIVAESRNSPTQRTYEEAVAARDALEAKGLTPLAVNIFTMGPHARRSQIVFGKIFDKQTKVGVIAWQDPACKNLPWWSSSERAREMLTETAAFIYELFFNSGRSPDLMDGKNSPTKMLNPG